ncbi:MAG TPA: DUF433 domain-containing protein [Thermomicrobiales bacterium]|nr:DUF433 domain-containing protein [Thermomicrobiales bacterium]
MSDAELIERYITFDRRFPHMARINETGVPVWIIVDLDIAVDGDDQQIVDAYRLSRESIDAARAYYRSFGEYIDAKRLLNDAAFSA